MLKLRSIQAYYGRIHVLKAISLHMNRGEIVSVIGANGAGKSTLLKTIAGLLNPGSGSIIYQGEDISGLPPEKRIRQGIALCPEGRRLFKGLSVEDNILLGAYVRKDKKEIKKDADNMRREFPILDKFWKRSAGSLSGGEQQMVALCRALMASPELLLLDEPSLGLSPLLARDILQSIERLNREKKLSILLVEQNARAALKMCHRAYVLETGRIVMEGEGKDLLSHKDVQRAYLGKGYKEVWER
ncbi:MAG: ABC transporter ATP-binding protein [Thermodesulfobacteriota bacterium]